MTQTLHLFACLLVLAVAAAAPGAAAPTEATSPVQGASYSLTQAMVSKDLRIENGTALTSCGSGTVRLQDGGAGFQFLENATQTGCANVFLSVTPPVGATRMSLAFLADRIVNDTSTAAPFPPDFIEELRRVGAGGASVLEAKTLFDPAVGSKPATPFAFDFQPSVSGDPVVLEWRFEDRGSSFGQDLPSPGKLQSCSARISSARITFHGIPLAPTAPTPMPVVVTHGTVVTYANVTVNLTPDFFKGLDSQLDLLLGPDFRFQTLDGPRGSVDVERLVIERTSASLAVHVPRAVVEASGPGAFVFHLSSTAPLPPKLPGPGPTILRWLPWGSALLPLAAAATASQGVFRLRREMGGYLLPVGRSLLGALALGVAVLVATLVIGLIGYGIDALGTLPISTAAGMFYLVLLLLAVFFLALWWASTGRVRRLMRAEIASRKRHEEELERSNRDLEMFAHAASHDLQEPLRKVVGFNTILEQRYAKKLDSQGQVFLRHSVEGARRMQALVRDLLAYSRARGPPPTKEAVDLAAVAASVIGDLQPLVDETGARITVEKLPVVHGSRTQLAQVLQNLIANAMKYHHPKRTPVVRVDAVRDGDAWVIQVHDNGVGIEPRYASRLFEPFQRLHTKQEVDGSGIGLALVRRIVRAHGGKVGFRSVPGEGSTFYFTIPGKMP